MKDQIKSYLQNLIRKKEEKPLIQVEESGAVATGGSKISIQGEYAAGRDIIIIHPITNKRFNIPSIESVLRKKEAFEGDFFRKEPVWVDFEQGFIVERKEVKDIINGLESNNVPNNVQLVLGAPASGKSIILKNVGYILAKNDKKKVHIVELKKHSIDEVKFFFENIPKMIEDNQVFIVDDAHLNLSYCERLAKEFKIKGKGNLIIGSRETREITEEHPKEGVEYELLNELSKTCIHIQAEDVTNEMIKTFLEKQYHFEEDRIQTVSEKLESYREDLWFLSWALKSYNKDKDSVDIEGIYEKISDSIEKIKVGIDKEPINAEEVFLPLSILYRYEIPVERYFLEEQLGIEKNIINQLIAIQEIAETKEAGHKMLSLHHSSLAELYFGAYLRKTDLGRRIKKKLLNGEDDKDLEYCSFYQYLTTTYPTNALDVVISLDRDFSDYMRGKTLLKSLIEEEKILNFIGIGINKEADVGKIGRCLLIIANIKNEKASKLAYYINIAGVKNIMSVTDASGNSLFLAGISIADKKNGMGFVEIVAAKVDAEEDIENIYGSMHNLAAYADVEVAFKVFDLIDLDCLSLKLDKEKDIEKVVSCLLHIEIVNKEVSNKVINRLNPKLRGELQKRMSIL